jgi:hypothetical protein
MTNTNNTGADKFNPFATLERGPVVEVYGCVQERPVAPRAARRQDDGFDPFAPCGR